MLSAATDQFCLTPAAPCTDARRKSIRFPAVLTPPGFFLRATLRLLSALLLLLGAQSIRAATLSSTSEDEFNALQLKLGASNEEWSVILPKLQRILLLRDEVDAMTPTNSLPGRGRRGMDSPMGGTSLDTPTFPGGMPRRGFFGGGSVPFDPSKAPGHAAPSSTIMKLLGVDTPQTRRAIARNFRTGRGNSVEALLSELNALLESEGATKAQIQEKLASIQAARARAARDLRRARADLAPLLTVSQLATLVTLGYLD